MGAPAGGCNNLTDADLLVLITDLWLIWFFKQVNGFDENIWIQLFEITLC